jgi:hypothetical protein
VEVSHKIKLKGWAGLALHIPPRSVLALSLSTLYFQRRFLHRTTAIARKKITGDELSARMTTNGVYTETKTRLRDLASRSLFKAASNGGES